MYLYMCMRHHVTLHFRIDSHERNRYMHLLTPPPYALCTLYSGSFLPLFLFSTLARTSIIR